MKKKTYVSKASIVILLLLTYSLTFAFTVDGTIYDVETNEGIESAWVTLILDNNWFMTTSDENGYYIFYDVEPNYYSFRVTETGYVEHNSAFTVSEDMTYDVYMEVQLENGFLNGTVTLSGGTGNMQSILITAGNEETNPDIDGNYSIEIYPGTYDVIASLEYYVSDTVTGVVVEEGITTDDVDLTLVYCDPPENLSIDEEIGFFTWDAPASGNLTGYNIYLDSVFLENITDTEFQFEDLVNEQTYTAGVATVYDDGTSEIIEIEFTYTPILNPPTNLEVDEATGLLIWDAPVSRDLTGYDIYLDSVFLENVTDPEFTFLNLIFEQTYLAGVSAVYDNGTSEIVETNFTYTPILYPPYNVLVDESEGIISWEEPILTNTRDLLGYDVYLDDQLKGSTSNFEWQYIDLVSNQNYTAGVIAIYDEGSSEIIEIDFTYTGTSAGNDIVSSTNLIGNYPNPFNPTTTISFSVAQTSSFVNLDIYNLKGQKIKQLVNSQLSAGQHSVVWNGNDEKGKAVSSGMYFYKIKAGTYSSTKKMILLK